MNWLVVAAASSSLRGCLWFYISAQDYGDFSQEMYSFKKQKLYADLWIVKRYDPILIASDGLKRIRKKYLMCFKLAPAAEIIEEKKAIFLVSWSPILTLSLLSEKCMNSQAAAAANSSAFCAIFFILTLRRKDPPHTYTRGCWNETL